MPNQDWNKDDETLSELLQYWNLSEPILIGQYTPVANKEYGFFNDIQDSEGTRLNYPERQDSPSAIIYRNNLEADAYYQFSFCLSGVKDRQRKDNRFLIKADSSKDIIKVDIHAHQKIVVKGIFEQTGATPLDALNLAKALTRLSGDLYTETERFIFEILQNADDLPGESKKVKIEFVLLEEHLLIVHNGKPFTAGNVKALSAIGASTQSNNSSTTGYKGIGFKSVFTDSDCVYVHSGNYSFKYDSTFYEDSTRIPWQIKPIWVEENDFPEEIKSHSSFFKSPVSIALRVGNSKVDEYRGKIRELFSEPRFMLFLRHINLIEVSGLSKGLKISLKLDKNNTLNTIYYNDKAKNSWIVHDVEFDVNEEIRNQINKDTNVPDKLKNATKTKLSFAIKIEDEKLVLLKAQESVLFTYLPTKVKDFKFPFLVNADFLTTANREDLHRDNDWNAFIFENLAYEFFISLRKLCTDEKSYRNFITDLIPIPDQLKLYEKLAESFNRGFKRGLKEIAFIPSEESEELLKLSDAILDETGITNRIIKPEAIKSVLEIDKHLHFISNSLEKSEKFKELGVNIFNVGKLVEFLKKYSFSDGEEYLQILKHLQKKGYGNRLLVEQVQIIYDEMEGLIASTADCPIYFQPSEHDKVLLTFADFLFIHPGLDLNCKEDPDIHSCLKSLGVKEFHPIKIIQDRIKSNLYEPNKNEFDAYIDHIKFIFKYRGELTHDNYQELSKLKVLYKTDGKYYPSIASDCYLSDYYNPDNPPAIAQGLGQNEFHFIISDYASGSENESVEAWRQFFLNIGVKEVTALELVRQEMNSLLDKPNETTLKNVVQITTNIFNHRQDLTQDDFERLSNLPVLLKNNQLAPAKECYFAHEYQPKQDLEDLFAGTSFINIISSEYINQNYEDWKEFFKKIKVLEEIRIDRLSQANIESSAPEVKNAFKEFAKKPPVFPSQKYLVLPDFIRFYSNRDFNQKIWKYISKNWDRFSKANNETNQVTKFLEFVFTEYPSIPCTDDIYRKPSEIYSFNLKNSLANCDLHISAIELTKDIEKFLGLNNSLDVQAYLKIVDRIISNFKPERDLKDLESSYQQISKICHNRPSNSDKDLIKYWSKNGKLIGCDDLLHPISELFYIDQKTGLSHKRNSKLVRFPAQDKEKEAFRSFLEILGVKMIGGSDIKIGGSPVSPDLVLPEVIKERVNYLSIYLINSTNLNLVFEKEQEIIRLLDKISFTNCTELYYKIKQIESFKEPMHNYYGTAPNCIFYIGAWNSRKNSKIGEYLIQALELGSEITSEKLLDFLDDPIHDVRQYLITSGFDIPELPPQPEKPCIPSIQLPDSSVRDDDGTSKNPEYWGEWGENHAKTYYTQKLYRVEKQENVKGYDFLCSRLNEELFVEVKAISCHRNVIRITRNEWNNMCKLENQEKYELFIVVHKGEQPEKIIRVKSVWKTLMQVLLKIDNHSLTSCEYSSKNIESLIGFQRNSNGTSNDIIFNWKRLLEEPQNPNIDIES